MLPPPVGSQLDGSIPPFAGGGERRMIAGGGPQRLPAGDSERQRNDGGSRRRDTTRSAPAAGPSA